MTAWIADFQPAKYGVVVYFTMLGFRFFPIPIAIGALFGYAWWGAAIGIGLFFVFVAWVLFAMSLWSGT